MKKEARITWLFILKATLITLVVICSIVVLYAANYQVDNIQPKTTLIAVWCLGVLLIITGICTAIATRRTKP